MGLAELPRLYFAGFAYWAPSTMNNNDNQPTYDPASATLNWPWMERHGLEGQDDFDAYVTQPTIVQTANTVLDPFVISAAPPAEWNFYGDNTCGFVQEDDPVIEWPEKFTKPAGRLGVTGYTNDQGTLVTDGDPWIGQPVRLGAGSDPAKLVDVDPICPWSSQIFVDTLGLGSAASAVGLIGTTAGRAHARWVLFPRNLNQAQDKLIIAGIASSMWQLALPADDLKLLDPDPAPGSLAAQLEQALAGPGVRGLMMRFVSYATVYFQGDAFPDPHPNPGPNPSDWNTITALYHEYATALASYERGERETAPPRPVNRAYSNTVGWVAPWIDNDMRSMATGRVLHSSAKGIQPVDSKLGATVLGPAVLEYAADPANPEQVGRVTIDLGSTIPELDPALTKVDFGTLNLALAPRDDVTEAKPFAEIAYSGGYDAGAYVATAGVIDIPASQFLAPLAVADLQQRLVVTFTNPQTQATQVGLTEADYTAETDDRGVYLDEPGAPWSPPEPTISVQVRYRGGKPPRGTRLLIAQYSPDPPGFGENGWRLVSDTDSQAQTPFVQLPAAEVVEGAYITVPVPHEDDGLPYATVSLAVSALRPGPPVLQFTPLAPGRPGPVMDPQRRVPFSAVTQQFFANVRVLPFHNEQAVAFENWLRTGPSVDLVTQRVFDVVFRTFFLMYPAMRFIRDPLRFQALRGQICEATAADRFESAAYMPVTRSLSAGQRRILALWNSYLDGKLPTPVRTEPLGRRG